VFTFGSFYQRWDIFNFNPRHPKHHLTILKSVQEISL